MRSGKVEVTEDEKIYQLEANNMIIHTPWEFHRIKSAGGTSTTLFVLSFYADGKLPKKLGEGVFTLTADQIVQYNDVFEGIHSFSKTGDSSSYAGQNAADKLSAFFIELSEESVATFFRYVIGG